MQIRSHVEMYHTKRVSEPCKLKMMLQITPQLDRMTSRWIVEFFFNVTVENWRQEMLFTERLWMIDDIGKNKSSTIQEAIPIQSQVKIL